MHDARSPEKISGQERGQFSVTRMSPLNKEWRETDHSVPVQDKQVTFSVRSMKYFMLLLLSQG